MDSEHKESLILIDNFEINFVVLEDDWYHLDIRAEYPIFSPVCNYI